MITTRSIRFYSSIILIIFCVSFSPPLIQSVKSIPLTAYYTLNDHLRWINYSSQCLHLNAPFYPFMDKNPLHTQCLYDFSSYIYRNQLPPMDVNLREFYLLELEKLYNKKMELENKIFPEEINKILAAETNKIPTETNNNNSPQKNSTTTNNGPRIYPGATRLRMARLTIEDLKKPENWNYARGFLPYILVNSMAKWNQSNNWSLDAFNRTFGHIDVYFHPRYVVTGRAAGIRVTFAEAIEALLNTPEFGYIYWNPYFYDWKLLKSNITELFQTVEMPEWFEDDEWIDQCLMREDYRVEFILRTAWKLFVWGAPLSGMYLHQDTLFTQSYQAHVMGSKRWFICDPHQSKYLYTGKVNAFEYDFNEMNGDHKNIYSKNFPLFQKAVCFEEIVNQGEIVYYPPDYWHQTLNLGPLMTMGLSGTLLNSLNYRRIAEQLVEDCKNPRWWFFSEMLCEQIMRFCIPWWEYKYGNTDLEYGLLNEFTSIFSIEHKKHLNAGLLTRTFPEPVRISSEEKK